MDLFTIDTTGTNVVDEEKLEIEESGDEEVEGSDEDMESSGEFFLLKILTFRFKNYILDEKDDQVNDGEEDSNDSVIEEVETESKDLVDSPPEEGAEGKEADYNSDSDFDEDSDEEVCQF
jgi:hypothetical protein